MLDRKDCPCMACPRRSEICHAQCMEYHKWAAELRARKFAAHDKRQGELEARHRFADACIAQRRRRNMKNGK